MENVKYGMSHFLSGQCQLADVICATNVSKLHVAIAGPATPNPTELLSGERFHKMIESLKDVYAFQTKLGCFNTWFVQNSLCIDIFGK